MSSWPADAPRDRVIRALGSLGYEVVRTGNHISLAGIDRGEFLRAYKEAR